MLSTLPRAFDHVARAKLKNSHGVAVKSKITTPWCKWPHGCYHHYYTTPAHSAHATNLEILRDFGDVSSSDSAVLTALALLMQSAEKIAISSAKKLPHGEREEGSWGSG